MRRSVKTFQDYTLGEVRANLVDGILHLFEYNYPKTTRIEQTAQCCFRKERSVRSNEDPFHRVPHFTEAASIGYSGDVPDQTIEVVGREQNEPAAAHEAG